MVKQGTSARQVCKSYFSVSRFFFSTKPMKSLSRFYPLTSRLRPKFGFPNDIQATAESTWQVSPPLQTVVPRALFEELDLTKITGGSPDRDKDSEIAQIWGGERSHAATVAFELRDAIVVHGNVFTWSTYVPVTGARVPLIASLPRIENDEGVLASSAYGVKYFGHWLLDDVPRLLAARDLGKPVSVLATPTRGQQSYIDLLGLACAVETDAFFRRLIVIKDTGQNLYKRDRNLRLRVMARHVARPRKAPGVMLLRGTGQARTLINEAEVAEIVRSRGFLVLDPATATAQETVDACMDVDIVLGVEGSQLANGLAWMAQSGTLLVLQPPQRFVSVLKDHCDNLGMRYAFIVCDPRPDGAFHVKPEALQRMLDRIAS